MIEAYFKKEAEEIETLEARQSEKESELAEAMEAVEYEAEEDEKGTAKVVKEQLVMMVKDLQGSYSASAEKERKTYQAQLDAKKKLDPKNTEEKKKITALNKDKKTLQERLDKIDDLMIGQQITEEECKKLILKKLYDQVAGELQRYLNAGKRGLIALFENGWDKYAVSSQEMEDTRNMTIKELNEYLNDLGYLGS